MAEFVHSYHRRRKAHDYHAPFIYHIIFKKDENVPVFGKLRGDIRIPYGIKGHPYIFCSPLGNIIAREINRLPAIFPILQIYCYIVMPDHVHILLRIKEWSPKHLGHYIANLKAEITKQWNDSIGNEVRKVSVFKEGYCDKPLYQDRSLNTLFLYIKENPYRLAVRKALPQFFQRSRRILIDNTEYEAYGNLFLLRNPDKDAVVIHRCDSQSERQLKKEYWLECAETNGVLVSPFISTSEKEIRNEAEEAGGKFILLVHEEFGERYKPAKHDFELCVEGRLLIISLKKPHKTPLSRQICLEMNKLAQRICSIDFSFEY